MSAYVVSTDAIDLLVSAAIVTDASIWDAATSTRIRAIYADPTDLGRALLETNVASVTYRYASSLTQEEMADYAAAISGYAYREATWPASAAVGFYQQGVRTAENYSYQACEHPQWEASPAHAWVEAIREGAIKNLPGMADAHWNYSRGDEAATYGERTRAMMARTS